MPTKDAVAAQLAPPWDNNILLRAISPIGAIDAAITARGHHSAFADNTTQDANADAIDAVFAGLDSAAPTSVLA